MTIDPTPADPIPAAPAPVFRWGLFIGGMLLALVVGGFLNIFSGLVGMSSGAKTAALVIGAMPGAIFVLLSLTVRKNGFAQGLLVGGCIIGLLGGICGAMMVGK